MAFEMHKNHFPLTEVQSGEARFGPYLARNVYIFYGVGIACALLRILIRCAITRRLGLGEFVMMLVAACYTGYIACVRYYLEYGTNLMTPSERLVVLLNPELLVEREKGSKALLGAWFLYLNVIWGCKLTLWLVCKKLRSRAEKKSKAVLYMGILLAVTYVVSLLVLFMMCTPFRNYWKVDPGPGSKCTDNYYTILIIGSLNIATDLPLIAIPMPIVYKLQIGWGRKGFLYLLFGVGICAVVAALGRILDVTMNTMHGPSTFWALMETTCILFVANFPGIQSAFTFLLEVRRSRRANARVAEYEMRVLPPRPSVAFTSEFSERSLMGSTERIVADAEGATVTIVARPLGCELAPEWKEEREGVRIRPFPREEEMGV